MRESRELRENKHEKKESVLDEDEVMGRLGMVRYARDMDMDMDIRVQVVHVVNEGTCPRHNAAMMRNGSYKDSGTETGGCALRCMYADNSRQTTA